VGLALLALPFPAHAEETLRVIVFPGGFNWPIWAAQGKGFFAREGLAHPGLLSGRQPRIGEPRP